MITINTDHLISVVSIVVFTIVFIGFLIIAIGAMRH
jgi:hypothetical protein